MGADELAHLEMIGTMVRQLTRNLTPEELEAQGLAPYYIDRGSDVYAANAQGAPFTAAYFAAKGDPLANILEDMAADGATVQEQH
ncbi:manganese catalase family protein [Gehongia tenuis]